MKILFISSGKEFFGGEKILLNICQYMISKGFKTRIIIPGVGKFSEILEEKNIEYSIIKIKNSISFNVLPEYLKLIKAFNPDIIHSHGYNVNQISRIVSRLTKIPIISVLHVIQNFEYKKVGIKSFFYYLLDYLTNKIAFKNVNVAVSKPVYLSTKYLRPVIIENGVEFPDKEYNIPKQVKTFGILGRIVNIKGIGEVLQALKKINDNKIKLLICGSDLTPEKKWEKKYKEYVLDNKLNVEFLGYLNNIEDFFEKIDCLILSSWNEPFGLVLIEAIFRKKLVIHTNCGGPKLIMERNMFLAYDPKNTSELLNKIKTAVNLDEVEIKKLVNKNFEDSLKKYTLNKMNECHENLVNKLLKIN